ncbi:MAG: sulfurtransferase [Cytophagales bacterium]|nr:sulfurtransferase [Cytophagales bacterium]
MVPDRFPLITPAALGRLLRENEIVLLDARTGPGAPEKHAALHLAGARFVDAETELAGPTANPSRGGRHPLPRIADFARALQRLGITPQSRVVVYDDKNGSSAAARCWWMLRAVGHESVQVLDGGLQAALAAGVPTGSGMAAPPVATTYPVSQWLLPLATIDQVATAARDARFLVIDVRAAERYRGETEPIDAVAGHIGGAVNVPFTGNLDPEGFFLPPAELKQAYEKVLANRPAGRVIVHCGSGVTACHTLLALAYAGLEMPSLYVGSWSEWSRTGRPVARTRATR